VLGVLWRGVCLSNGAIHCDLPGGVHAYGINSSGQVVGDSGDRAFLYTNGTTTDLGTLGGSHSYAYGINDKGQVVGSSTTISGSQHAFLYSDGTMTDLNSRIDPASGWTLTRADDINDLGQIVGYGNKGAFLLTPLPEPSTLVLLGVGAIGLPGYAWRRRAVLVP
jgi:probable HAF family extracellular repeat protein